MEAAGPSEDSAAQEEVEDVNKNVATTRNGLVFIASSGPVHLKMSSRIRRQSFTSQKIARAASHRVLSNLRHLDARVLSTFRPRRLDRREHSKPGANYVGEYTLDYHGVENMLAA